MPTYQELSQSAQSNLYGALRDNTRSEEQIAGIVNKALGNASMQDLQNYSTGKIDVNALTGTAGSIVPESGIDGITSLITPEEIRAQEAAQREAITSQANALFDPQIQQTQKTGERRIGATEGQFGAQRGLGFSSAQMSFLNQVSDEIKSQVDNLQKQKEEFIRSGNIDASTNANNALIQLQNSQNEILFKKAELALSERSLQQSQQQFEAGLAFDKLKNEQQYALDKMVFEDGKQRFERSQGLLEEQFNFDVTVTQREQMVENLKLLAGSQTPINSFDDEEITKMEKLAGLPSGSFEAFYSRLLDEASQQQTVDDLTIDKLRAEVKNINSQISARSASSTEPKSAFTEGFLNRDVEREARSNAVQLLDLVQVGEMSVDEAYIQLRTQYSQMEVTDSAIRTLLGVTPAGNSSFSAPDAVLPGETVPTVGNFSNQTTPEMISPNIAGVSSGSANPQFALESTRNFINTILPR